MPPEAVQPLRITKSNSTASNTNRMPASGIPRPLAEISPMGVRRNSPSFSQATKGLSPNRDSSPFDASPKNNSPRLSWRQRESLSPGIFDTENMSNRTASPSPTRRSSLENLMKASRVKNNNMFLRGQQQTHEPESSPPMNKPMAKFRPFSTPLQGTISGSPGFELPSAGVSPPKGHRRAESTNTLPVLSPSHIPIASTRFLSPKKDSSSPQKSSLLTGSRYAAYEITDPDETPQSDNDENASPTRAITPRALRQPKSVSFDVAPPHINEYERPTPEPSSLASDSREGSYDSDPFDLEDYDHDEPREREDSFDDALEDTEQTPVVLPEDWRFMIPTSANTNLADDFDDAFEGKQEQNVQASKPKQLVQNVLNRSDSVASNGEARPLPPLPGLASREQQGPKQAPARFGILPSTERLFPTPPPAAASVSKAEVLKMQDKTMTLAERMRLLNVDDHNVARTTASRERSPRQDSVEPTAPKGTELAGEPIGIPQVIQMPAFYDGPPRISRESILREVKSQLLAEQEESDIQEEDEEIYEDNNTSDVEPYVSKLDYANLDPDVPIPSRETSSNYENEFKNPTAGVEDTLNLTQYIFEKPDVTLSQGSFPSTRSGSGQSSVVHYEMEEEEEFTDAVSIAHSDVTVQETSVAAKTIEATSTATALPTAFSLASPLDGAITFEDAASFHNRIALPDFASFETEEFGLSLQSYMTPTLEKAMAFDPLDREEFYSSRESNIPDKASTSMGPQEANVENVQHPAVIPTEERPVTPEAQVFDVADIEASPDSVIHNLSDEGERGPTPDLPEVPEPVATIRTPGGRFKTRKSATPADMDAMALARRVVSGEPIPPIPEKHRLRPCTSYELREERGIDEIEEVEEEEEEEEEDEQGEDVLTNSVPLNRRQSFKFKLDVGNGVGDGLDGVGLAEEFDRLMDAKKVQLYPPPPHARFPPSSPSKRIQKSHDGSEISIPPNVTNRYIPQRGYLMRQNTKVVVASNRQLSGDVDNLQSATGSQTSNKTVSSSPRKPSGKTWTTEPWNGKMRRQSTRRGSVMPVSQGPVPPMPGQASVVGSLAEEEYDDLDGTAERGRLFIKVVGVKNLDLPLPRHERTSFQLTLDNGLHCVTTSTLELGNSAPIGQEFELTVFDDLEFHLTLQTKLQRPKARPASTYMANQPYFKPTKTSALGRLLVSPKKRREQERKQQEQEAQFMMQNEREIESLRAKDQPTGWDLLHELVGEDGSFARAYVSLHDHEADAFGRATTFNLDCWNEWALEEKAYASTRSKLGGIQRRPPYKIGTLEVQMLYIPKPRNAKDEDMPKSMSAAVRQLKEAEAKSAIQFEGFLSQQGGDCPYWRRRFFKLEGSKLTSYHETTRQRRATINLARAARLIDDRPSLTQNTSSPSKGRRKSAFAEDEEGFGFVEEGFRIRFSNGEVIDFYADSAKQKEEWMSVLCGVVGKDAASVEGKKSWVEAVHTRQQQMQRAAPATDPAAQRDNTSAPTQRTKQLETTSKPTPVFSAPPKFPTRRTSRSAPTSPIRSDTFTNPASQAQSQPQSQTLEDYMMTRAAAPPPHSSQQHRDKPLPVPSQPSLIERAREKAQQHMRHKSQPEALGGGGGGGGGIGGFMRRGVGAAGGENSRGTTGTERDATTTTSGRGRRQMIKSMIF